MTIIFCAFRIVLNRWAIVSTVRPSDTFSNDFCISDSETLSNALVASSNINIGGFCVCVGRERREFRIEIQFYVGGLNGEIYSNKGSGDGHALFLSAAQHHAALPDHRIVAIGKCFHKIVNETLLHHAIEVLFSEFSFFVRLNAVHDVVSNRSAEQNGLLTHRTDIASQPIRIQILDVDAIQVHTARLRIVQAKQQRGNRRFAASTSSHNGRQFVRFNCEINVSKNGSIRSGGKTEIQFSEFNLTCWQTIRWLLGAGRGQWMQTETNLSRESPVRFHRQSEW